MKGAGSKIYFIFDMNTPGTVFIKLVDWMRPHVDHKRVGKAIIDHIAETKEPLTRFTCRFLPVDILCKAGKIEDFKTFAEPELLKIFTPNDPLVRPIPWCMEFKKRNNDKIKKHEYFDYLKATINNNVHPVQYEDSHYEVVIEIFRDMLVLAILPKYKTLKKYNLQSLCGENDKGDDSDGDEAAPKKVVKLSDLIKQKAEADKLGGK